MSFVLNRVASLLATLVVVGIALFCSSAAHAHANHGAEAVEASVRQVAAPVDRSEPATVGDVADEMASAPGEDGGVGDHRVVGSSCCGTGMSNCMAATVGALAGSLPTPPLGTHDPVREPCALDDVLLDGMIRPPKALV